MPKLKVNNNNSYKRPTILIVLDLQLNLWCYFGVLLLMLLLLGLSMYSSAILIVVIRFGRLFFFWSLQWTYTYFVYTHDVLSINYELNHFFRTATHL